jgi:hypothetical protein
VGQSRDLLRLFEEPWHPAELALPVLFPSLVDEAPRRLVGDDLLCFKGAGPEHADGVVVGQHDVAHRLVGVLAQLGQPLAGRGRRCPDVEADEEVLALDGADVRVPFCGQGIDAFAEYFYCLDLLIEVGGRGERLARVRCHDSSLVSGWTTSRMALEDVVPPPR